MTHTITLHPAGTVEFIGDDPLRLPLENIRSRRLSNIWPLDPVKRAAFRLLRLLFGDEGRVAAWTRRWHGPWEATIIDSKRSFIHFSRAACVAWERSVLENT